ncbi:MAG: hypothetical protein PCFJNLEI_02675 [Verrucomicrobiae bacterium]|nr:hypothetical protein [Verrucomicrobiae bacterium]
MLRVAFIGFRHGHIFSLYDHLKNQPEFAIVATCEEHAPTREKLTQEGRVAITHRRYATMLAEVDCDVVAVGDYYSIRGRRIIEALRCGKHVVADKPICTSLTELKEIARLARAKRLQVSCQLDMRGSGVFRKVREILQAGTIGEVHAIHFTGQHPLLLGTRPGWYFEKGRHGGTINDIAIHAIALLPWVTGLDFSEIVAARTWNAFAKTYPHFRDAAQFMVRLNNGCGVFGDVSYFMPDSHGYALPQYWRFSFYGRKGVIEAGVNLPNIFLALAGESKPQLLPVAAAEPFGYLNMLTGRQRRQSLTTGEVLQASRITLCIQHAADTGKKLKL